MPVMCRATKSFFGNFMPSLRRASSSAKIDVKSIPEEAIRKSVFISQSNDIFTNLALEDWFYRNFNFNNHHVLLLWKNNPCVVIGRHQNPWVESNVQAIEENGVALARRNSGGGTVYHDHGNLNLSFFTPRERYNRRYNLDIISRALFREWGLKSVINKREDIMVQGEFKVSGTAAKLGRPNAYHHCTLLVGVNKSSLHVALEKKETGITSNATESTRSAVKNLTEINANINIDQLLNAVGWEYLRTKSLTLEDGGYNLVKQQNGFQMINPTEEWFPGIEKLTDEFRSWTWNFGKTPKFTVTRILEAPASDGRNLRLKLILDIENGIVESVKMTLPTDAVIADFDQEANVITNLRGTRYSHDVMESIVAATGCKTVLVETDSDKNNVAAKQ